MDGGCLDIWLNEATSEKDRFLLQDYAKYVGHLGCSFTVRHREPRIVSKAEERKIIKLIGYLPKEEIVVCDFADFIFQASEEILTLFEGYLHSGIPQEELEKYQGLKYRIKVRTKSYPWYHAYQLLTQETVREYFNKTIDGEIKSICSIKRFLKAQPTSN
jgi:hypothetical protein